MIWSRGSIRLRTASKTSWAELRNQTRCYSFARPEQDTSSTPSIMPVASEHKTDYSDIGKARFRELAFVPEKPLLMKAGPMFLTSALAMPAIRKWFDFVPNTTRLVRGDQRKFGKVMSAYLTSFAATAILPFELAYPQSHRLYGEAVHRFIESLREENSLNDANLDVCTHPATRTVLADLVQSQLPPISELMNRGRYRRPQNYPVQKILHFTAPLALLDAAIKYNLKKPEAGVRQLYVAQAPLNDLPKELQDDLPVPKIVKTAGKGDIYDSSVWIGLEPTYTPLHRDPNPNLFIQLCGNKIVRLLPPASGGQIFRDVQLRLSQSFTNSRLRGPEMMNGPERELMYEAIWHDEGLRGWQSPQETMEEYQNPSRSKMQEARLQPGDALFIPKGWWHSVKSEDEAGRLNASVNWWFR